jgi:hypothetical protein
LPLAECQNTAVLAQSFWLLVYCIMSWTSCVVRLIDNLLHILSNFVLEYWNNW